MANHNDIKRLVLIVDDEIVNREMLGFILGRDYNVIYAKNGVEALEQIQKNKSILSIVLLDLLMPEMDGFKVLKELQNIQELSKLPVIVLTSEKSAEIESLKLGAVDFITKPYDMPEVILARVRRSIELSEGSKIIQQTSRDELTGLLSKDFFYQYCARYDKYYPETPMDAVAFHIFNLSLVNEINGRFFATEIIKKIADELKALLNKTTGLACRFSDTFYLYIEHRADYNELLMGFLDTFNNQFKNTSTRLVCGVNAEVDKKLEVYKRFDKAMSACSSLINNNATNINHYDIDLHKKEIFEECLLADMETSLANNDFEVFYQPKYDISGDRVRLTSSEALVRWNHPQFGTVSPEVFIPLMESNGLVSKLDHFVWQEAASQINKWKKEYNFSIPVSVNLSRIDLYNPELVEDFLKIIEDNGITTKDIYLEITESTYTDNFNQVVKAIKSLRAKGFFVEMDDFGTGYSPLNMLAELPFDCLKLDIKFIQRLTSNNDKSVKIVELMMDIAKFLNVSVVAEGVETQEQCDILKGLNKNTIIQGFNFSAPLSAKDFKLVIEKELEARKEDESKGV